MNDNVKTLFIGDQRLQTLYDAVAEVFYERGKNLPLPSTLGILRLLEHEVVSNAIFEKIERE